MIVSKKNVVAKMGQLGPNMAGNYVENRRQAKDDDHWKIS